MITPLCRRFKREGIQSKINCQVNANTFLGTQLNQNFLNKLGSSEENVSTGEFVKRKSYEDLTENSLEIPIFQTQTSSKSLIKTAPGNVSEKVFIKFSSHANRDLLHSHLQCQTSPSHHPKLLTTPDLSELKEKSLGNSSFRGLLQNHYWCQKRVLEPFSIFLFTPDENQFGGFALSLSKAQRSLNHWDEFLEFQQVDWVSWLRSPYLDRRFMYQQAFVSTSNLHSHLPRRLMLKGSRCLIPKPPAFFCWTNF